MPLGGASCLERKKMSKLIVQKVQTQTDGSIKDHQYGIGDVGLVLEILRNKLYKDPILAVVREYITNARDAHVEVGKADVPIVVHLPSYESMYFKVQDFGPGLSPERIEKIFCNYASSTKRNSEDQVGYFGIGSKSAFAYSDSFTITSVVDGKIRTYSSYIDESRRGKISCLYEADTDQPNGTTIIIPVKKYDQDRFLDKLRFITEFWSVRPSVFKDDSEFKISYVNEKTVFSGDNWKLARNPDYDFRGTYAIMGGIPYAIDMNTHFESHPARNFFNYSCVRINFNNSDLSLAASRDSLHYDARTIRNINDKLDSIISEINIRISEQISQEPSYKDALIKYNEALDAFPELNRIIGNVIYDSKPVHRNPKISMFGNNSRLTWYSKVVMSNGFKDIKVKTVNYKNPGADADFANILSRKDTVIIFNDLAVTDLKKYATTLFNDSNALNNVVVLSIAETKDDVSKHKHLWFAEDICYAKISEITPGKTVRQSNRRSLTHKQNLFLYSFDPSSSRVDCGRHLVEVSPNETIAYFLYDLKTNAPVNLSKNILSCIKSLESALGMRVFAVATSKSEKIPSNWKYIDDVVTEKFNSIMEQYGLSSLQDYLNCMAIREKVEHYNVNIFKSLFKDQMNNNNFISSYLNKVQFAQDKFSYVWDNCNLKTLAKHINKYHYLETASIPASEDYDFNIFFNSAIQQYPMLKFCPVSSYTSEKDIKSVNDYIEMVDRLNKDAHVCIHMPLCA
jgi:hypothetical protein